MLLQMFEPSAPASHLTGGLEGPPGGSPPWGWAGLMIRRRSHPRRSIPASRLASPSFAVSVCLSLCCCLPTVRLGLAGRGHWFRSNARACARCWLALRCDCSANAQDQSRQAGRRCAPGPTPRRVVSACRICCTARHAPGPGTGTTWPSRPDALHHSHDERPSLAPARAPACGPCSNADLEGQAAGSCATRTCSTAWMPPAWPRGWMSRMPGSRPEVGFVAWPGKDDARREKSKGRPAGKYVNRR